MLCTLVCTSQNYATGDTQAISFEKVYKINRLSKIELPIDFVRRIGLSEQIYKQFVYDYIICNMDRHERNNEILINTKGKMCLAPYFDNSLTFILLHLNETNIALEYNENMMVNNYIGNRNLLQNLYLIDKKIVIRTPVSEDRAKLFQGLGKELNKADRDFIWTMLIRRVQDVKDKNIRFIQWR